MNNIDVKTLKAQAAGQWPEILSSLGGCPREILDGRHHPCPKCGGQDRFRMIDEASGGLLCNQCFKKANGDGLAALQWLCDWDFPTTVKQLSEHLGNGKPSDSQNKVSSRIVETYDYCDEKRDLLYQVVRYDPKKFRQRRPKPEGGWDYKVKGVRLVPYRLPGLLAADPSLPVLIVEGEKDADHATKTGMVATTCVMGGWKVADRIQRAF